MGMNSKTRLMFNLSYIHSYIEDILEICSESDYNYPLIFTDKKSQYAINMCCADWRTLRTDKRY